MPGLVINISSARSNDSFVEQRIEEVRNRDLPGVRISDFALWDVKPGRYSPNRFKVFVGSGYRSSKILSPEEKVPKLKAGEQIIQVPETFRESFETNLPASIRDLAGVATAAVDLLFRRVELIKSAHGKYQNPLYPETLEIGLGTITEVSDYYDLDLTTHFDNVRRSLLFHPRTRRFIHVDLAKNGDCAGITCLCIPFYYEKKLQHSDRELAITQKLPFIFVDFFTRIKAPPMDEISFEKIRQFLVWLRDNAGYYIERISYDSWQSVHSLQLLQENGFATDTISVDRTDEPYLELHAAYVENRIQTPPYEFVGLELRKLLYDISARVGKVDHPSGGCFVGETRIPLLNGTRPMISDLMGKEVDVYSCTLEGKIVPGVARGRITKHVTSLVDVVLDSGAVIRCTPDHPFMLRNGGYKPAKDLTPSVDRLMPLNLTWPVNGGYERLSNKDGDRVLTHHMVETYTVKKKLPEGWGVHHKNEIKTDNSPSNLERMALSEHSREHTYKRHNTDVDYHKKVRRGLNQFNNSKEGREKHRKAIKKTMEEGKIDYTARARSHSSFRSDITFGCIVGVVDTAENPNQAAHLLGCSRNVVIRVLKDASLDWQQLKQEYGGDNHKVREVISVELPEKVPVYDLEVDTWSNFALCAGVFVHNSKDVADSLAGAYANALDFIHKNGFGSVGAHLVTDQVIKSLFAKTPRELRAMKVSKELGYKEPVTLQSGYDGKFYGAGKIAR